MLRHVRTVHSQAAQQRTSELNELNRLELLHGGSIPSLSEEEQTGGAVTTRSQTAESKKRKREDDDVDMSSLLDDEGEDAFLVERANRLEEQQNPLFKADLTFMPYKRVGLKGAVKKQQFSVNFDQLRPAQEGENLGDGLSESLFQATRDSILQENLPESTKVHLTLTSKEHTQGTVNSNNLVSHFKYGIPIKEFVERGDYVHAMFQTLANKMNSAQQMNPAIGFNATLTFITYPEKGGKGPASKNPGRIPFDLLHKKKKGVIQIKNSDHLCCARAIVTMREYVDGDPHKHYRNLRDGFPVQERLAKLLHKDAGVPEGPCGVEELQKFQAYLGPMGYKIVVMDYTTCACIFKGDVKKYDKVIYLVKHNADYNGVKSMLSLLNRSYFCPECCKGFNDDDAAHHSCMGRSCQSCQRTRSPKNKGGCPDYASSNKRPLHCQDCGRDFYGPNCFDDHKVPKGAKKQSLCQSFKKCLQCCKGYKVNPKRPHKCYHEICRHCKQYVNIYEHRCYIQPATKYEESYVNPDEEESDDDDGKMLPPLFVYADIECLVEPLENGKKQFVADHIRYATDEDPPNKSHPFSGDGCISQFIDTLYGLTEVGDYERNVFVIFHNLKGFDGNFIQEELYRRGVPLQNLLTIGSKTLMFNAGALTFKDSLCFLPMPLAQLPETFNFEEHSKGFFPHAFHTRENLSYRGPLPAKHHFQPQAMKPKTKKAFETWYAGEFAKNEEYVLWKELEKYCHSDVMVLKTACQKFIEEFREEAGFNPMEKCATIASACNLFWRRELVPKDTIAIEPTRGWRGAQMNQSKVALEWLCFEDYKLGHNKIKHVRSGGEQSLPVEGKIYKVDGFDPVTRTVYEFHGCFFHACPECFPKQHYRRHNCHPDRSLAEVHEATCKKTEQLRNAGYTVIEMWECDFEEQKKTNPALQEFLATFELVEPLNPRDSFFGGRTNGVRLYCEAPLEEEDEIRYADINSLYPYVNKTKTYPVGHPEILVHPTDQNIDSYFGIAKVKILPPANLYHPVLPVRIADKLMFPLCTQCVSEQLEKPWLERSEMCFHTEEQRCLYGTWCTPELQKAVEKGYQIKKIYEVWHFSEDQRKTGLFAEYVDKWLKIKQESAGWPRNCTTEEKKAEYIQEYSDREGVLLDSEKVNKNGGRKQVAKLMLNSFWGKFGEKPNKTQTHTVTSPAELYELIDDQGNNIHDIRIITEDVVEVDTTKAEEEIIPSSKTNIFIASFTTAWARLELYSYLDLLKEQVLYFDTDSIIYYWKRGLPEIQTGPFLGQMKDELEGDSIHEFVTGGPKNYAYKLTTGKAECKVRGFTQDEQGMALLNFESIKEHVLGAIRGDEILPIVVPVSINMVTDRTTKKICLTPKVKKYQLVFEKRVVNTKDCTSRPYGYDWIRDCLDSLIAL